MRPKNQYCNLCNITMKAKNLKKHNRSRRHLLNIEAAKIPIVNIKL